MSSGLMHEINQPGADSNAFSDPATEEALVATAKRGDKQAFETLVKRHQRRIFILVLRYTRVREDAEDIVQQTFQKVFVHLQKFEGQSSFSTWLTRIAINEALMLLRKGRAAREVSIDECSGDSGTTPALEIADLNPDPETKYLQRERAQILSVAIARLAPGMQRAIELQDLGELTSRETAEHLGLSTAAVKTRVFHGRRKLRETLERLQITPEAMFSN